MEMLVVDTVEPVRSLGLGVTSVEGAIMDPFGMGTQDSVNESGHMMVTAGQAQALREQEFRDMAARHNINISDLKGADFVNAAVEYKQHVDGVMRQGRSFFAKTSGCLRRITTLL